ncbi:MAG TPA: DUF4056 domain-containing protein [Verrucomicrobiales bacterium]|nr:DUF4056 domain-containing protein [Verrucomicrobiales bacterium]
MVQSLGTVPNELVHRRSLFPHPPAPYSLCDLLPDSLFSPKEANAMRGLPILLFLLTPFGNASAGGLNEWQAEKTPRLRIAASPYPNFLLKVLPTDVDLGDHLYRVKIDSLGMGPSSETSRGHFYTRRGGFLDLAHIRRAIDFAGYVHYRVRHCLEKGETHFSMESIDKTTYHCHFSYPAFWHRLAPVTKKHLIEEIAIRVAGEAAIDFSNWREIITWYDFHNVPGMPEKGSSFSYEDLPSHLVGAAVASRALRAPGIPFDEAVTRELRQELDELDVVPEEVYFRAMDLVAYRWWGKNDTLKRFLDTGEDDGLVSPWLVRGLEPGKAPKRKSYEAPERDLSDVAGYDCRGMIVLECEPHMPKKNRVLSLLGPDVSRVRPERDYPAILGRIRSEVIAEFGPHATVPYP